MQSKVTNISFHGNKNCFLGLPRTWTTKLPRDKILVYEVSSEEGTLYASWAGAVSGPGQLRNLDSEVIEINGLYGSKQALKHGQQVLVSPVSNVAACHRLFVEPLSPNDWEILEMHSTFVEGNLLNQVRVVWAGQIFPIWVQKSICVFVKIARIEAATTSGKCFLIEQNTEVIVSPKVRSGGHHKVTTPIKPVSPALSKETEAEAPSVLDEERNLFENSVAKSSDFLQENEDDDPFKDMSGFTSANTSLTDDLSARGTDSLGSRSSGGKQSDTADKPLFNEPLVNNGLNSVGDDTRGFAELPLPDFNQEEGVQGQEQCGTDITDRPRNKDHWLWSSLRTWWHGEDMSDTVQREKDCGSGRERKAHVKFDGCLRVCALGDTEDFELDPNQTKVMSAAGSDPSLSVSSTSSVSSMKVVHQSTNVFISLDTLVKHSGVEYNKMTDVPTTFYATLKTLDSPTERNEKMKQKMNRRSERLKQKAIAGDSKEALADMEKETGSADASTVVRVVVLDLNNEVEVKDKEGQVIAHVTQGTLPRIPAGHVMLGDQLRRLLGSEVTGRVRLTSIRGEPSQVTRLSLYPLFSRPSGYTADMLETVFDVWLSRRTSEDLPLVVTKGTLAKCWVKEGLYGEFLLTFDHRPGEGNPPPSGVAPPPYVLLHPGAVEDISVSVQPQPTETNKPPGIDRLPYWSADQFDLALPKVTLNQLGGVEELANSALDHISMCLGLGPLSGYLVGSSPGLHMGGLMVCGPRGSGKSSLAQGVCHLLGTRAPWPYVVTVDCKALKGKRPENIKTHLEAIFNELSWRQPAVLLLEDLDQIVAAPSGPEQEMSGEAQYFLKNAEVLKDLLLQEKSEGSRLAVVATCKSPGALHPALVSPTGHHLYQEVVTIKPPDQKKRQAILESILLNKNSISLESKDNLDLGQIAQKTEGYVARDLETVVDKAIHAHLMSRSQTIQGQGHNTELLLTESDLETALKDFTPASLRNVTLHKAGELGWCDIGGLHDVRSTLVQTLEWPARYPRLFSSCPLRLRSGILLYGAPGTGKTLLAGVVAKECGLNFISIKGPELLSKYIGASEQAVRDTFVRAQSARPCILFFDEFDSLAPRRGHDSTGVTDRVVNQLLTQLDGVEGLEGVYVLGATSRPDLIDPALLRPGRLDKALHCAMPLMEERLEILKALTRNMDLSPDIDLRVVAENSEHFTGADFKALLYNAQLAAIHEATDKSSANSDTHQMTLLTNSDEAIHSGAAPQLLYMPNLEEGVTTITAEKETKLLEQVQNCLNLSVSPDKASRPKTTSRIVVTQTHLVDSLRTMAPSVSQAERDKYHRIYDHFVASRGGNFSDGVQSVGKRATLA